MNVRIEHTNNNPRTLEVVRQEMLHLQAEYFDIATSTERKQELETILKKLEEEQDTLLFEELERRPLRIEPSDTETPPTQ